MLHDHLELDLIERDGSARFLVGWALYPLSDSIYFHCYIYTTFVIHDYFKLDLSAAFVICDHLELDLFERDDSADFSLVEL